jgi:hypothetical protein
LKHRYGNAQATHGDAHLMHDLRITGLAQDTLIGDKLAQAGAADRLKGPRHGHARPQGRLPRLHGSRSLALEEGVTPICLGPNAQANRELVGQGPRGCEQVRGLALLKLELDFAYGRDAPVRFDRALVEGQLGLPAAASERVGRALDPDREDWPDAVANAAFGKQRLEGGSGRSGEIRSLVIDVLLPLV